MARTAEKLKNLFILMLAVCGVRTLMLFTGVVFIGIPVLDGLLAPLVVKLHSILP